MHFAISLTFVYLLNVQYIKKQNEQLHYLLNCIMLLLQMGYGTAVSDAFQTSAMMSSLEQALLMFFFFPKEIWCTTAAPASCRQT